MEETVICQGLTCHEVLDWIDEDDDSSTVMRSLNIDPTLTALTPTLTAAVTDSHEEDSDIEELDFQKTTKRKGAGHVPYDFRSKRRKLTLE